MGLGVTGSAGVWITRQAVRRGLLGSSRAWFAVFLATSVAKGLRRVLRPREPSTVLSQRLEPGAGIEVRHLKRDRG